MSSSPNYVTLSLYSSIGRRLHIGHSIHFNYHQKYHRSEETTHAPQSRHNGSNDILCNRMQIRPVLVLYIQILDSQYKTNPTKPPVCHNSDTMWHIENRIPRYKPQTTTKSIPKFSALRLKRSSQDTGYGDRMQKKKLKALILVLGLLQVVGTVKILKYTVPPPFCGNVNSTCLITPNNRWKQLSSINLSYFDVSSSPNYVTLSLYSSIGRRLPIGHSIHFNYSRTRLRRTRLKTYSRIRRTCLQ